MPTQGILIALASTALKCSILIGAGLLIGRVVSRSSPATANLIYRQSLLLTLLIPATESLRGLWLTSSLFAGPSTTKFTLPTVQLDLSRIVMSAGSSTWIGYFPTVVMFVLAAGTVALLLRTISGGLFVRRVLRSADFSEMILSNEASEPTIQLWFSDAAIVPFACGIFRKKIVLPSSLREKNEPTIRVIIQHELIHIERHDNLWGVIGYLAVALNWYNPLVWIAYRSMIFEAERCCDAGSIRSGVSSVEYASLLIELSRFAKCRGADVAIGSMIIGKKQMEARIMSILQSKDHKVNLSNRLRRLVVAGTVIALLPMAALQVALTKQLESLPKKQEDQQKQQKSDDSQYPEPDEFVRVDSMPAVLHSEPPVYPEEAKKKGVEGSVWIKALVDKNGTAVKALVDKTSGEKSLDEAAQAAALKCTYKPALAKGKKVAVWVTYEVKFVLKTDQKKP